MGSCTAACTAWRTAPPSVGPPAARCVRAHASAPPHRACDLTVRALVRQARSSGIRWSRTASAAHGRVAETACSAGSESHRASAFCASTVRVRGSPAIGASARLRPDVPPPRVTVRHAGLTAGSRVAHGGRPLFVKRAYPKPFRERASKKWAAGRRAPRGCPHPVPRASAPRTGGLQRPGGTPKLAVWVSPGGCGFSTR